MSPAAILLLIIRCVALLYALLPIRQMNQQDTKTLSCIKTS